MKNPIYISFAFFYALFFAAVTMISCSNKSTDKPQLVEAKDSITVDSAAVAYSDSVLNDSNIVANIEGFAKEDIIMLQDIAYEGNKIILSNRDQVNLNKLLRRADNKEDIAVVIFLDENNSKMTPRYSHEQSIDTYHR